MNSKGLYQSSGKENESCCLAFMFSTKREFRHFHVVVVQRRQKNVPIDFLPFSLPPPSSSLLKLPKDLAYPVREILAGYLHRRCTSPKPYCLGTFFDPVRFWQRRLQDFSSNFSATLHVAGTMWASSLKDFSKFRREITTLKKVFFFLQNVR